MFDHIRSMLTGERICSKEHLDSYKRIGEQVYEVEVEMSDCQKPRVRALLAAAKSLNIISEALLKEVFDNKPVSSVTHEQAEKFYGLIPDLLIGIRQENVMDHSSKVKLPISLSDQIVSDRRCPTRHLAGMRRAADEMERLLQSSMERFRASDDNKPMLLRFEEARIKRQIADAMVGSIMQGQKVSEESHEKAEEGYWDALETYFKIAQQLEDPSIAWETVKKPRHQQNNDIWRITSRRAMQDIRQSGEWEEAEKDIAEFWEKHSITAMEREYETIVSELENGRDIRAEGYWNCCPFQPVYRVLRGPLEILGYTVPAGHMFVWDYGENGQAGRLITQASFQHAERQYCED
ncbi:hypothetical protein LSG31_09255 [Fodinisporobacter ferrooxydans]|uniref:Uncharacterized protein n=1 Tax=Fodinisporobacter ferrooxydans TaxID=2901836 RepID=A0ABY4CRT2_9BACL|nr:hypothetical protein LSG31_09255 [Alicyclobacillaceae bacterium MYW30-H2]